MELMSIETRFGQLACYNLASTIMFNDTLNFCLFFAVICSPSKYVRTTSFSGCGQSNMDISEVCRL